MAAVIFCARNYSFGHHGVRQIAEGGIGRADGDQRVLGVIQRFGVVWDIRDIHDLWMLHHVLPRDIV